MKVALIGGAGVRAVFFTNGLATRAKDMGVDKLVLHDIDNKKLNIIGKICKHVASKNDNNLEVELTTDVTEALGNADYIITTIRVGGDHSRVIDEEIAFKFGLLGQETTGAGGFSMALRTIPVLSEYCKLAKELAPNAWMFNFTNPSGLVTQALRSMGYDRVIGICDTPSSTKLRIAQELGIEADKLYVEFFGLNHLSWINKIVCDGNDILGRLVEDVDFIRKVEEFKMFDPELMKIINKLPNEYLYYFYHSEQAVQNIIQSGVTRGRTVESNNIEMMKALNEIDIDNNPEEALQTYLYYMTKRESTYMSIETNKDKVEEIIKEELVMPDSQGYAGVMMDFAEAIKSETGRNIVLSVPNNGSIPGLEDDDVVEITCNVSRDGIIPAKINDVSQDINLLIKSVKLYERLTVEAIKHKSRDLAIKALMVHPLVNSYSLSKNLVNEYLTAYRDILGEWK
jgi:6-phospho-beta-glucosidase